MQLKHLPKTALFISVVTTDRIAVRNTGVLTAKLKNYGIVPRLIINRFKLKGQDGGWVNIDGIIDTAMARLIGIVPEDKHIAASGGPLLVGNASSAVFRIASRIEGNEVPLPSIKNII